MEREGPRNFSIEPYIDGGGIMGDHLQVDEAAASSVMKRTALRRDFNVAKGYFRERQEFEGDEVLAMSTARINNERHVTEVGESGVSTLVRQRDQWLMLIHDQEIGDKVDEWMKQHFKVGKGKSGQEVFAQKFAQDFGKEVTGGVRNAFWNEKKQIFKGSFKSSSKYVLLIGVLSSTSGYTLNFLIKNNRFNHTEAISDQESLMLVSSMLIMGLSAIFIRALLVHDYKNLDPELQRWERILPNFQIPSVVAGNVSLAFNSGKLIRLKQS